jgi:hypothetical protein
MLTGELAGLALLSGCSGNIAVGSNNNAPSQSMAPVITSQPASGKVLVGANMVFSVAATGTPAPTYQWQVSTNGTPWTDGATWTNVSTGTGATTSSYATAATSFADDGAQFRVLVTNSAGQTVSNVASLDVGVVTHGSQIDATNTGVPSGHTLTDVSSTIIVTESWIAHSNNGSRVIHDKNFLAGAGLIVTVDGFTVQYCKFNGRGTSQSGDSAVTTNANDGQSPQGTNVSVLDSEFDGNNEPPGGDVAIFGASIIQRVNVHNWPRALWIAQNNLLVKESYIHDLWVDGSGAHIENIYVAGGVNQKYIRNKLMSNSVSTDNSSISASLAIYNESYSDFTPLDNIQVIDNYMASDGGYSMYGGACIGKSNPYATNMTVTGNIFGRDFQRYSGVYGAATAFNNAAPTNAWKNNTWGPPGPDWQTGDPEKGAEIAASGPS